MTRKVIIHIGLHKTATRFIQHDIFSQLNEQSVEYNPKPLMQAINALYRNPEDTSLLRRAQSLAQQYLTADTTPLLISKCDIPGNMFYSYQSYQNGLALIKKLFPQASIIYFVRKPSDWLLSAYKQSIVKGHCGPIENFLNYFDDGFHSKEARYINGMRNLDALALPFLDIYKTCAGQYGADQVATFCYEDLRHRRQDILTALKHILGLPDLPIPAPSKQRNKSFSALAITLFCPCFVNSGQRKLSETLPPKWLRGLVFDPAKKIRSAFIRHLFDRIIYRDWDMLEKHQMRKKIDEYYEEQYQELQGIAKTTLSRYK